MDVSYFMHCSKVKLGQNLYVEALLDAEKVIELNSSSHLGYELKYAALRRAQRYDDASEAFTIMLSKLDNAPDPQIRQLRQQYVSPSEVKDATRRAIDAQLENAPLRLINTITGHICDRNAQFNTFTESTEYKELSHSLVMHVPLQTKLIKKAVVKHFGWVMLSHRWGTKEPGLHDIQGRNIYDLNPVGTIVKLQNFCRVTRNEGYRWAWVDTCCIDQNNHVEVQQSVNSMFVWYHYSALTIVYLSDVPPSSKWGTLASSIWNTRGWTVQEFLAPKIVLFYQADWSLYLDDCSRNHKESVAITQELESSTGINARALVAFRPGMRDAREKLRWASTRVTTLQEDIAYSLFGIFGVHLPVIYGEKRQNALGRLLQEIIAHSGDITALDWKSGGVLVETGINVLHYEVKADGLKDLLVTTEDSWFNSHLLSVLGRHPCSSVHGIDKTQSAEDWREPGSPSDDTFVGYPGYSEQATRELRLIVRLGRPFGALLLAQQWGGEYKRIATDNNIIAQVRNMASVDDMMDVRTVEIL
ncbi:heterokaryon incompatibility protein-domain-containing protein [Suillus subaureus]|uniref:Heterokaryon incompatibility protein-domain-containing protein n=1 Tax=Suillus subaureus TaxID=48587 RepID=A0A9P7EIL6_9AGAM|nr:heterokaryon incompatibility protein-domain-containing protein [Suillus subaureus]KAG1821962.1 heterokaryon incompatibility protein-domain-containing protein [Suillus subaureus]